MKLSKRKKNNILFWTAMLTAAAVTAQDGNSGINQANSMVRSYFDTGVNLMYAIGAIFGLIGAIRAVWMDETMRGPTLPTTHPALLPETLSTKIISYDQPIARLRSRKRRPAQ
jgi:hypothetical protein